MTVLAYLAVAVVVAAAGFRLGTGDAAVAVATAVAGCPLALLVAAALARLPRPPGAVAVRAVHPLDGTDRAELLRLAAALHHADDAVGRALAAAATSPLPGVSDLDGTATDGLRGIVSDLRDGADGPVVVAHAVLVGPAGWAAAHGVDEPPGLPADALLVAWDGVLRGAVEVGPAPARPGGSAVAAVVGMLTAPAGGLLAPLLAPVALAAWPVAAALVAAGAGVVRHTTR